jgi:putative phosphoesterase
MGEPVHRIALFSDVHGNLSALDAVLADIKAHDVDEVLCLGDLVGYGPDPAEVVARIRELGIRTIQGNYDEGIGLQSGGCGCHYATPEARADGDSSYSFTAEMLDESDRAWLTLLPETLRTDILGVRVVFAHGSPRKNNEYLLLDRTDEQLVRLAEQARADLVCVGHVHIPYHRSTRASSGSSVHYVNSGSVGKPKDGDPRAGWVEVALGSESDVRGFAAADTAIANAGDTDTWIGVVAHRVSYDIDSVVSRMESRGLPRTLQAALLHG